MKVCSINYMIQTDNYKMQTLFGTVSTDAHTQSHEIAKESQISI